jgi:hypothetical protein
MWLTVRIQGTKFSGAGRLPTVYHPCGVDNHDARLTASKAGCLWAIWTYWLLKPLGTGYPWPRTFARERMRLQVENSDRGKAQKWFRWELQSGTI